jgi:anti-sigma factor RsiW
MSIVSDLDEALSRLWSGELAEAEARLLRERIEAEPEVGRRWRRLCSAMEALKELPAELPAPPLRERAPAEAPRRSWGWVAAVALAAAALLALMLPRSRPELVLVEGAQWVEGEVLLRAGAVDVEVDGRIWISVEPPAGQPRVGVPEPEEEMDKSTVIAGLTGAIVTVVVYQGTAVLRDAGASSAEPTVIEAGERHRTGPAPQVVSAAPTPQQRLQHIDQLQRELDQAKQELAEAQFEGALTRGQLQALQGVPSPWPEKLPEALQPEHFRANLEARLKDVPDVEISEVDCSEYPCVAAMRYVGERRGEDWGKPIGDAVRGWMDEVGGGDMSISVNNSRFHTDDHEEHYVVFGAHEGDRDTDVGTRTEYRIDAMVDELGSRLKEGQ